MARPQINTVSYFPHYISDGKKMFFIEHKYGNDGYSTWFKILESLASTEYHFLDLQNESDVMFLSAKCRVEEIVLISILNDLSKLGEIDTELWNEKIVFSEKFIKSIQDAYSRRNSKCMQKDGLCKHLLSLCRIKPMLLQKKTYSNPQSKVEHIKVNEIKVNLDSRKLKFSTSLNPFLEIYGKDFLNNFYNYWIEENQSKTKLKFELEKTWNLELRLKRWANNEINFKKNNYGKNTANLQSRKLTVDEQIAKLKSDSEERLRIEIESQQY